jgi:tetrahydrodipicolinate N-succinyltransferase
VVRTVVPDLQEPPRDTADAWLRLHLLSHRLMVPHSVNLDGIFALLTNVVWTSAGPCAVDGFETTRMRLRAQGHAVSVFGVDKFPRMTDYVVPAGVRIADADRVRLGAGGFAPGCPGIAGCWSLGLMGGYRRGPARWALSHSVVLFGCRSAHRRGYMGSCN